MSRMPISSTFMLNVEGSPFLEVKISPTGDNEWTSKVHLSDSPLSSKQEISDLFQFLCFEKGYGAVAHTQDTTNLNSPYPLEKHDITEAISEIDDIQSYLIKNDLGWHITSC